MAGFSKIACSTPRCTRNASVGYPDGKCGTCRAAIKKAQDRAREQDEKELQNRVNEAGAIYLKEIEVQVIDGLKPQYEVEKEAIQAAADAQIAHFKAQIAAVQAKTETDISALNVQYDTLLKQEVSRIYSATKDDMVRKNVRIFSHFLFFRF